MSKCIYHKLKWVLYTLLLTALLSGCRLLSTSNTNLTNTVTTPKSVLASQDYSQPQAVIDLFYQLVLEHKWEDAYSLLTKDSKEHTKLGDFVQFWAANEGRTQLVKFERVGQSLLSEQKSSFYIELSWDQAYPKPGGFKTYSVKSLIKENGAWRLRWRNPEDQFDLGREYSIGQSQINHDVSIALNKMVLLERSTLVFFTLANLSGQTLQFDPDLAQLILPNKRTVPLETTKADQLGLRTLKSGQKREEILFFRALEPAITEVVFVSPKFILNAEKWDYRFSVPFS